MLNESKFLALLSRQQESGLSVQEFCSNEGITESTFYYWRRKLQNTAPSKGFIPLVVKPQTSVTRRFPKGHQLEQTGEQQVEGDFLLEVVYPNGTKLRVKNDLDLSHLRALIFLYN